MSKKIDLNMLERQISETQKKLEHERKILSEIADDALKGGENLGLSTEAMKQSGVVGKLVLEDLKLRKLLAEYEPNESPKED